VGRIECGGGDGGGPARSPPGRSRFRRPRDLSRLVTRRNGRAGRAHLVPGTPKSRPAENAPKQPEGISDPRYRSECSGIRPFSIESAELFR